MRDWRHFMLTPCIQIFCLRNARLPIGLRAKSFIQLALRQGSCEGRWNKRQYTQTLWKETGCIPQPKGRRSRAWSCFLRSTWTRRVHSLSLCLQLSCATTRVVLHSIFQVNIAVSGIWYLKEKNTTLICDLKFIYEAQDNHKLKFQNSITLTCDLWTHRKSLTRIHHRANPSPRSLDDYFTAKICAIFYNSRLRHIGLTTSIISKPTY